MMAGHRSALSHLTLGTTSWGIYYYTSPPSDTRCDLLFRTRLLYPYHFPDSLVCDATCVHTRGVACALRQGRDLLGGTDKQAGFKANGNLTSSLMDFQLRTS
ncbi:hypothetical protein BO70DRAFT_222637 [Aspergillus heteromorphus CBS 117.55]|uniref:Uncharacterized protein n=1 Tax=Aspergillus heteromorphus CBS 117.55 TaxID=1448321 RepID=A0A317WMD6_9EURO|nr:uncharacterized protein BO70DRAFT_222637 [Aspergillus heteromorphus CBS 117.55]PWY86188.1 hypothetical protein BO70DRAFT_222637 [Aspergillus heteromorphus CBS 117.55]